MIFFFWHTTLIFTSCNITFWKPCTDEHSQFIEHYVEKYPICIVKDATDELCKAFEGLKITQGTVYRHLTGKLSFTLTRTQPKGAECNCEDNIEAHRQFVEYIIENNIDFKKNMVRPVVWSKKG